MDALIVPMADISVVTMDFLTAQAGGTLLQTLTLYLFFAGTVAMGAGALYFFLLRGEVAPEYRSTMVVAGLVCAIACFHYYKMTGVYQSGQGFPTALRYVDWLFTTPLLLMKFPLLLRMGDRGAKFFWQLVGLDVAMIVTAFIAETSPVDSQRWWTFFIVSCAFELMIVGVLFVSLGQAIKDAPAPLAKALETMRLFVLIGWAIYPIGYMTLPGNVLSGSTELAANMNVVYNIGDAVNKIGFGLVIWNLAKRGK